MVEWCRRFTTPQLERLVGARRGENQTNEKIDLSKNHLPYDSSEDNTGSDDLKANTHLQPV